MTHELQPVEFIDEFFSGEQKNYAYRIINSTVITKQPKTIFKVRGINQNYGASQLVIFDVIKNILNGGPVAVVMVHTDKKIKRKRKERMYWF